MSDIEHWAKLMSIFLKSKYVKIILFYSIRYMFWVEVTVNFFHFDVTALVDGLFVDKLLGLDCIVAIIRRSAAFPIIYTYSHFARFSFDFFMFRWID